MRNMLIKIHIYNIYLEKPAKSCFIINSIKVLRTVYTIHPTPPTFLYIKPKKKHIEKTILITKNKNKMPGFPMYAADEFFTGNNFLIMISKSVGERDQQMSSKKQYLGNSEDIVTWTTCFFITIIIMLLLLLLHKYQLLVAIKTEEEEERKKEKKTKLIEQKLEECVGWIQWKRRRI